jgi:hypothetical protein
MFGYNTEMQDYKEASTRVIGQGYWANYASAGNNTITGSAVSGITVAVSQAGWVLLGSMTKPINVNALVTVPAGTMIIPVWHYNPNTRGYDAVSIINPGEAVWVLVNQPRTITFPTLKTTRSITCRAS